MELGKPARLSDQGNLPTSVQVYSHYLLLRSEKVKSGEWKPNVSMSTVVKEVASDLLAQWDKTAIPHNKDARQVEKRVGRLVQRCQMMSKIKMEKRSPELGQDLGRLLDLSLCQHEDLDGCSCDQGNKAES